MESLKSPKHFLKLLRKPPSTMKGMSEMISLLWAENFNLPPNDERLLALTLREATEQLFGMQAVKAFIHEKAAASKQAPDSDTDEDSDEPTVALLTGDPVWDAMELADRDPARHLPSVGR